MNMQGQSAIVTSGGSGLGEAVAHSLAARGAKMAGARCQACTLAPQIKRNGLLNGEVIGLDGALRMAPR